MDDRGAMAYSTAKTLAAVLGSGADPGATGRGTDRLLCLDVRIYRPYGRGTGPEGN